jgi:hypothetical protein
MRIGAEWNLPIFSAVPRDAARAIKLAGKIVDTPKEPWLDRLPRRLQDPFGSRRIDHGDSRLVRAIEYGVEKKFKPGAEALFYLGLTLAFQRGVPEELLAQIRLHHTYRERSILNTQTGGGDQSLFAKLLVVPVNGRIGEELGRESPELVRKQDELEKLAGAQVRDGVRPRPSNNRNVSGYCSRR